MKKDSLNLEYHVPYSLGAPLFVIETDRLRIVFPFKGASRSICALFGKMTQNDLLQSNADLSIGELNNYLLKNAHDGIQNIFVLRQPKDRFKAAWAMAQSITKKTKNPKYDLFDTVIRTHGEPYIHQIDHNIGWKYILFDEIENYVRENVLGIYDNKKQTERRWFKKYEDVFDFDYEQYWYDYHVRLKKRMDPEEFRRLVDESNYINVKNSYLRYKKMEVEKEIMAPPKVTVFFRKNIMHIIPPRCGTKSFVKHFTGSPIIKRSITDEGYPFVVQLDTDELETLMKDATDRNIPIVLNIREPIERAKSGVIMTALWGHQARNHIMPILNKIPQELVTHVIPFRRLPAFTEKFQEKLAELIPESDKNYNVLQDYKGEYKLEQRVYEYLMTLPKITPKRYFRLMGE